MIHIEPPPVSYIKKVNIIRPYEGKINPRKNVRKPSIFVLDTLF